jgi:small GTP-binding protein
MQNNKNKLSFKVVVLGDSAVGKSSIVTRYVNKQFHEFQEPTIGAAFLTSKLDLEENQIKLDIWDTAGQERYRSLAPMYYRGAQAAIVVYDITNRSSFDGAINWIEELKKMTTHSLIFLIGNKSDLEDIREVDSDMVSNYARNNKCDFFETSAKSSLNVDMVFQKIAIKLSDLPSDEINEYKRVDWNASPQKKPKLSCCQ